MSDIKRASDHRGMQKPADHGDSLTKRGLNGVSDERATGKRIEQEEIFRERFERAMDSRIIDRIEMRYGQWIPPERLQRARHEVAKFQEKKDFGAELAMKDPRVSQEDIYLTAGYITKDGIRVKREIDSPATDLHERLHSVSSREAKAVLGTHLYEGMTEDLASRESDYYGKLFSYQRDAEGNLIKIDPAEYYEKNRMTVTLLREHVGEAPLMEAYFQGDDSRIQAFLDHSLGEGSWEKIRDLLETADRDEKAIEQAHRMLK